MCRTISRDLSKTIQQKREELLTMHEELEDLIDYLDVLEARARDQNQAPTAHADLMKRYRIK